MIDLILSSINSKLGVTTTFKEFENKNYFVINDNMTNVFINETLFKELESLSQYVGHEGAQKLINNTADVYVESLQAWIQSENIND